MRQDESLNYKLDSGIEALARGAIGATLGSILGVGLGFSPAVGQMLGRDSGLVPSGVWLAGSIGLGSIVGAMYYLRHR